MAIQFLIWLIPKMFYIIVITLIIGGTAGLFAGMFFGVKSYFLSIKTNMSNHKFRNLLYVMTIIFSFFLLFFVISMINEIFLKKLVD
jgi:H+/Cl- antiporter ClcA